jgi:2-keto-3-deoxy-L-rhamnonate aldolase RhmA
MNDTLIRKSVDAGADFIGVGVDTVALGGALRALSDKHR